MRAMWDEARIRLETADRHGVRAVVVVAFVAITVFALLPNDGSKPEREAASPAGGGGDVPLSPMGDEVGEESRNRTAERETDAGDTTGHKGEDLGGRDDGKTEKSSAPPPVAEPSDGPAAGGDAAESPPPLPAIEVKAGVKAEKIRAQDAGPPRPNSSESESPNSPSPEPGPNEGARGR